MASWVLRKKRHFITLGAGWPRVWKKTLVRMCSRYVDAPRDPHSVAATATAGSAVAWRAQ